MGSGPVAYLSGPKVGPMNGPETVDSVSPEKGIWGASSLGRVEGHCHTCRCGGLAGAQAQAGFTWRRGGPGTSVHWWEWRGCWSPGLLWPQPLQRPPLCCFPGDLGRWAPAPHKPRKLRQVKHKLGFVGTVCSHSLASPQVG